jgi:hypothetical protein
MNKFFTEIKNGDKFQKNDDYIWEVLNAPIIEDGNLKKYCISLYSNRSGTVVNERFDLFVNNFLPIKLKHPSSYLSKLSGPRYNWIKPGATTTNHSTIRFWDSKLVYYNCNRDGIISWDNLDTLSEVRCKFLSELNWKPYKENCLCCKL